MDPGEPQWPGVGYGPLEALAGYEDFARDNAQAVNCGIALQWFGVKTDAVRLAFLHPDTAAYHREQVALYLRTLAGGVGLNEIRPDDAQMQCRKLAHRLLRTQLQGQVN